jgi:hypothetical protein
MKALKISILVLVILGAGLFVTQALWVPALTNSPQTPEQKTIVLPTPLPTTQPSSPQPTTRPGKVETGVEGIVTIGPTCPVQKYPDTGACADKPYQTNLVISSPTGKGSPIVVTTDATGHFSQALTPGSYVISAVSGKMLPRLNPVPFTVSTGTRASLNLLFDSGIR